MGEDLRHIRSRIDALDERLVKLISARARLAQRIGGLKQGTVYRPEREAQVLHRVRQVNRGPLSNVALVRLFTEIMSACRALEDALAVAYLGPAGTFSQEAALKHFGSQTATRPCVSIDDVFRQVETGSSGYGVVPVENSTEGAVGRALDLLLTTPARVCGEVMLPVRQCVMSKVRKRAGIRRVYSHTQSLAQCQAWLARHLPHAERVAAVSNAEAARLAAKERGAAAIGSRTAAGLYGLTILARNVEDEP
ncbi:MAG: chorismate mutase, partial [Betaproteobacteria bacterium]|nr:chorismate mutase [Betaproteobacteria bacterium]